jgi:hypothetical protein
VGGVPTDATMARCAIFLMGRLMADRRRRSFATMPVGRSVATRLAAIAAPAGTAIRRMPAGQGRRLFQRAVDRGELGIEVGSDTVDHRDNGKCDAGRDQAVLDGGGAVFVRQKAQQSAFQYCLL